MIKQSFLNVSKSEQYLSLIEYVNYTRKCRGVVVLCHGLGQSKVEYGFFYSRLARFLFKHGFDVMQFDFRGHGDSSGELEDVTIGSLEEDIYSIQKYIESRYEGLMITYITKGMSSSILAKYGKINHISILPHFPNSLIMGDEELDSLYETISLANILAKYKNNSFSLHREDDKILEFFINLGGYIENLKGQKVSKKLIYDLNEVALNQETFSLAFIGKDNIYLDGWEKVFSETQGKLRKIDARQNYISANTQDSIILEIAEYLQEKEKYAHY